MQTILWLYQLLFHSLLSSFFFFLCLFFLQQSILFDKCYGLDIEYPAIKSNFLLILRFFRGTANLKSFEKNQKIRMRFETDLENKEHSLFWQKVLER